ncbi:gluconate:H+ symporter [Rapidithrix thailandica]|uniref:Gluconate:H+ symporter n=1 Tax=Rapidithrix thailandica TaxID=413964 RepID=A0AAW9S3P9_9BACT
MPLIIVLTGVLLLLLLITVCKLNAFISFVLVSIFVGLAQGLPFEGTIDAIQTGIGSTLSSLVLILGFGAMLGKIVAESGAAQRITTNLVRLFGLKQVHWALMITGFVVGIPMFYSVGFVILVPLAFTVAANTGLPLLYVGVPMLASLSVTHGYLPPHPAPTAIADMFKADIGKTLIYGIIIAIPAIVIAGPVMSPRMKKYRAKPLEDFFKAEPVEEKDLPSMDLSLFCGLLPVILIGLSGIATMYLPSESMIFQILKSVGNPAFAMLLSVLVALIFLGLRRGYKMKPLMDDLAHAVSSITMVLLIIAGAGSLKEVLVQSGVSDYIGALLKGTALSPLFLAWMITAVIRVCVGSATVSGLTAAGIMFPMVEGTEVSRELMVLAIGSGSLMLSHVNDGGFWMFKEYFNLSIKDTLSTWTVMETMVSLIGLAGVMTLSVFV